MKLVLIHPPGLKPKRGLQMHTPNLPIGLAYVASVVRDAGHEVEIVDAVGEAPNTISTATFREDLMVQGLSVPRIVARIPADADVIGITCMFSTQWLVTREVIRAVRKRFPQVPIVCGGEHMSALPEHILQTSPANVVVRGEGEETLLALLRVYGPEGEALEEVTGITYRTGDGTIAASPPRKRRLDIDAIPLPAWDLFPVESYIANNQMHGVNRGRAMPLLATRGCPFQCTFCSSPQMWTTRWLARDPEQVLDEIELYMDRFQATDFHFQDLTAIIRKDWIVKFCEALLQRGLKITWQLPSGTRSEAIDAEVARYLYRSGCRNMAYAPESGSDRIRKIVKKRVKLDKMLASIEGSLREGLSLSCFFVIGFPDDTHESLHETLVLVRRLARMGLQDIGVAKFVPYPGSAMFQQFLADGTIALDDEYFLALDAYAEGLNTRSFSRALTPRQLHLWQLRLLAEFYAISFVRHPLRTARNSLAVFTSGVEETRYAKMLRDVVKTRSRWTRLLVAGRNGNGAHESSAWKG